MTVEERRNDNVEREKNDILKAEKLYKLANNYKKCLDRS